MYKKLYRSRKDKMLGGVAGGLAQYFDIDPTLIRIIFVISLILGGTGLIAYIIMWIIVPEEPLIFNSEKNSSDEKTTDSEKSNFEKSDAETAYQISLNEQRRKRRSFLGIILVVLGFIFLAGNFIPRIDFSDFFPLILVAIGVAILINVKNK